VSEDLQLKILGISVILFAFLVPLTFSPKFSFAYNATSSPDPGIIIPLYSYPGPDWQLVIQEKQNYPSVSMVAVINPANGPGYGQDPNFVDGINSLKAAGVVVLGYVPTWYGTRPGSDVMADVSAYNSMYQVNGIFFDEMPAISGYENYYSTLSAYAKSLGMSLTVGNPGAWVPPSYIGTVDNIVIYENFGLPSYTYLNSLGYQRSDFSVISYGTPFVDPGFLARAASDVSYVYITDGILPSPYTSLASFFPSLVSSIVTLGLPSTEVPVSVESVDMSGNPVPGMWAVMQSGGLTSQQGFTPSVFTANIGDLYSVSVGNFGNYVFDHWSDGSTGNTEMVDPSSPTTLIAYYRPAFVSISVNSVDSSGNPIPGLWAQISSGGNIVYSGYTPFTFQGASGIAYTISMWNYGSDIFSEWNTGSTNSSISLTPDSNTALQAIY
jgi:hypothetical protein